VDVPSALAAAGSSHELQLWSAEQPSLYVLLAKLAAAGQLLEVEGCQVSSGLLCQGPAELVSTTMHVLLDLSAAQLKANMVGSAISCCAVAGCWQLKVEGQPTNIVCSCTH
jgi:hypothetical protein